MLIPENIIFIGGVNLFLGTAIGVMFGFMVNIQSFIAGIFNGGMGGIMGTMIGAVALDPTICSLPATTLSLESTILFFSLFSTVLLVITAALLYFALRV
ncbi:hypothetical protein KP78_03660 [Jeotgalibacillus soli]|uniref:Uncharacterized protein n=2 Tax=Jeotgalibacillus soli TaxID=889306 RepID=A0A0C2RP35_9BACL|nr:hypothetical protein KP78_03660 [Jeotgalibacillus soli]